MVDGNGKRLPALVARFATEVVKARMRLNGGMLQAKQWPTEEDIAAGGWNALIGTIAVSEDTPWQRFTDRQLQQTYGVHAVVRACLDVIVDSITEAPLGLYRRRMGEDGKWVFDPVLSHPTLELVRHPNAWYSENMLQTFWIQRLLLTGKSFILKLRNRGGTLQELWPMPTSWVKVDVSEAGTQLIKGYKLYQGTRNEMPLPVEDVSYTWFPNPSSTWDGLGPMQSAIRDYQLDRERENYLVELMRNMRFPGLALKFPDMLTNEQRRDLRAHLRDKIGLGRRGSPLILQGGASAEVVDPLKDLDWPGYTDLTESRICAAFGIPPIVVGVRLGLKFATYSNYATARKAFYRETLQPFWPFLAEFLSAGLIWQEGGDPDLMFRYDTSGIQELQEDRSEISERAGKAFNAGTMTLNEARREMGYAAVEGGDIRRIPVTVLEEAVEPRP